MSSSRFALSPDGRRTFAFLMAATLVTSVHHVYRLGPGMLPAVLVALSLPPVLIIWYRRSGLPVLLRILGGFALFIYLSVGIFDGFLDHTLKALGLPRYYMLAGSEAEVVTTYYNFLSVEAGHLFYEATGIATFLLGSVAAFFAIRLLISPSRSARVLPTVA